MEVIILRSKIKPATQQDPLSLKIIPKMKIKTRKRTKSTLDYNLRVCALS